MRTDSAKILIAEDDLVVARIQKFMVERTLSLSPLLCKNGREALDYLETASEETDRVLVLLDLNMPEMNGWDFLEECKNRPYAEKIHVVIVTSSLFKEDRNRAATYEQVIGYYTKPVTRMVLQEIVDLPEVRASFKPVLKSHS